jgi:exodeoxyribonuclease-1
MAGFTFFWHDYETFGQDPRRDWPAQFAGQRTDAALNPIGAPVVHHCQPPRDRLPDPGSVLLTGITPQHCLQHGLIEREFADAIEAQLAEPDTVGAGYNSIRFDDEVTRHLFWRNLIDPYAREWRNGCGRWDLIDALRCAYALRPEGIRWPTNDEGKPSFRLEHFSAANDLPHDSAHDALADVRATLALARLLRSRQPRLWAFCLKLRSKAAVLDELKLGRAALHVSSRYAAERGCLAIVWPFAQHPVNRNEVIVWDLAHDPEELLALDAAAIRERLFKRSEELPEGVSRLPIKTIHINKSPVVIGKLATLSDPLAERWGIDRAAAARHAETAARITGDMVGVWPAVFERAASAEPPDVDEDLYGGFVGDDDRRTLVRLRCLSAAQLAQEQPRFRDERLHELLFRFRARNYPETLDAEATARWQRHNAARLHEGAGGATTLAMFIDRLDELADTADERGQALLEQLYDWAEAIAP